MFCLANCCRLCLCKDNSVVEYTCLTTDNVSYLKKLNYFAPQLVVDTETYYPTGICEKCQEQVNQIYNFIQQCLKAREILASYINKLNYASIDMITYKPNNKCTTENHTFTEVLYPSITSNTTLMESRPMKAEMHVEDDSLILPEFVASFTDDVAQNTLLETAEAISYNRCVKQEFDSDSELHETEVVFATVKTEPYHMISNKFKTIPCNNEKIQFCVKEDELLSDDSVSSAEFEPIRKNENTPRLKQYQCLKCVKKFSRYSHLLRHSRVHTGNRPFPCTMCKKSFSQLENLERHQLIHSDIKPYACTKCDKSFRDKSYLKKHIRLHDGIRYTCDICNKTYTNPRSLTVHKRKHTGERPFECTTCKNKYADRDNLRKHKKKCELSQKKC